MASKSKTKIKSHEKLGISYAEFGALLGVKAMLENRFLTHWPSLFAAPNVHAFNMGTVYSAHECGSVGCIGGNMSLIMGQEWHERSAFVSEDNGSPLAALFFPPEGYAYTSITPRQAVVAINNFLRTGKPMWRKVLGSVREHNRRAA